MQTIFLSYKWEDEPIASSLKAALETYQYRTLIDSDKAYQGGDWRRDMMQALKNADVVVPIYTEITLRSQFVPGEVGMARAYKDAGENMLIIPIIIDMNLPLFLSELHCLFLKSSQEEEIKGAAKKIHEAIQRQQEKQKLYPKIFISHRHKDEKVARAVVDLLEASFMLRQEDIRCTSVHPYKLLPGAKTSDRLRAELNKTEVVLGLISPDVNESEYVLFELGASWGLDVPAFPLLIGGAAANHVPGPLAERHCISLSKPDDCWQLIEELKRTTSVSPVNDNLRINTRITALVDTSNTLSFS